MKTNPRELRSQREELLKGAIALVDGAEAEKRDFSAAEQTKYDGLLTEAEALLKRAERAESMTGLEAGLAAGKPPAFNRTRLGDSEARAFGHYFRTGDRGGISDLIFSDTEDGKKFDGVEITLPRSALGGEQRAVVDSTMNITTSADGGALVPTGFAGAIVLRKNELDLAVKLGCRPIPGKGTTVNYPYENADPNVFATAAEQIDAGTAKFERDANVVAVKAFTLVKKARRVELTEELLDDEDVTIMDYVSDWIGREIALTHNTMLLAEVNTNGTLLKTFASATAIAAGEPEDIVFNSTLGFYLDDGGSISWIMRNPTFGAIAKLTGSPRLYAETPGGSFGHELLGYPVALSTAAGPMTTGGKSVNFGNFFYVGFRQAPELRMIRDPYSVDGLTILKYSFRAVFGVLQAAAVGWGAQA